MSHPFSDIPVAHIDDEPSIEAVLSALRMIHPDGYNFVLSRWEGDALFDAPRGRRVYRFVMDAEGAQVKLKAGDLVRGFGVGDVYQDLGSDYAETTGPIVESVWPGDVLTMQNGFSGALEMAGQGTALDVITDITDYRAPRLSMLRNLQDFPGGCAAYEGAFRREAIPPDRQNEDAEDQRGSNRVNEHTLDMRNDRCPTPIRHYHGPVATGGGKHINHTETALVLSRSVYGLPDVNATDEGHIVIFRRPKEDPSDAVTIPVRPGSIVVTPATGEKALGHCFENAFAMLVAVPGFVSPYRLIED